MTTHYSFLAAAQPAAAQITNTNRSCHLTVTIIEAQNLKRKAPRQALNDLIFRLKLKGGSKESRKIRSKTDEDGMIKVEQSFTFNVNDLQNDVLSIHVYGKGQLGLWESLGYIQNLAGANLLQESTGGNIVKEQWYELCSKDGSKRFPGKVLIRVVGKVVEPEQIIHAFVGTWNVGNAQPAADLSSWLPKDSSYEIVAVGAQECDYQPRQAYTECGKDWIETLRSHLGPHYKVIDGISRGQMRLVVFVRDDAEKGISERDSGSEATGVGHVMANKGGLCIAFKIWDTGLCFVNSHFAAHVGHCEARNSNYREIVGQLCVGLQKMDIMNQFHHVFWMGDLNYRFDFGDTEEKQLTPERPFWHKIVKQIEDGQYKNLLQFDELHREQAAGRVLHGFQEGEIRFPPTFKMQRGTLDCFDQKRMPAWCDRVLWRSLPGSDAQILSYISAPAISTSDHKPVAAAFALTTYALPSNLYRSLGNEHKTWHIRFKTLQAKNLRASDLNGFSDPYISFVGPNLFQEIHSKVKFQTLHPVWNPLQELSTLVLKACPLQLLEREFLKVRVLDYDYASADDTLGYGVIPLAPAVAAFKGGPSGSGSFVVELSRHGLPAGTLEGVMKLTWERNVTKSRLRVTDLAQRTMELWGKLRDRVLSTKMI